ncbi:MAG: thioredoxin domain-containing protein [Anaerolineae bacterium]
MTNRLVNETSPYLLQHAENPVDWYPWGEEALTRARTEDKPIFLSIGYSACHWCHVMAHESFEDPDTAALMNEHFISIKVDREERPDLDSIYMEAVVAMTGQGGWPMSVFLTPDGRPFYGGTYFPPTPRYGMPSFKQVLASIAEAYKHQRDRIEQGGEQLSSQVRQSIALRAAPDVLSMDTLEQAYRRLASRFDATYGGFGNAPKFPQPMNLEFLLRYHHQTGETRALDMVDLTLTQMASGGIYDQIGGGFHRYSTDARWLVPHFEKMLYDNALLARVYLHAWQVTGRPLYRRVVEETLDYVIREMTASPTSHEQSDRLGGFYSAQDADSEGEEGKFFLWTPDQVKSILGEEEGEIFCKYFDVTPEGNFEGKSILNIRFDISTAAASARIDEDRFHTIIEQGRRKLFEKREQREKPGRDEKVLTGWNGLMLAAFAEASFALNRPDYRQVAEENAGFVLNELRRDGRLLRSWRFDASTGRGRARFNAYLEDYAFYADGLLALYQATFKPRWFAEARALVDAILTHFSDPNGGFFDTSQDHEQLIIRPKNLQDNAIPSGNASAADVLLRVAAYTGDDTYRQPAEEMLAAMAPMMQRYPGGFSHWLSALTFYLAKPREIALIGEPGSEDTQALLKVALGDYRPHQVVALAAPDDTAATEIVPLLANRPLQNKRATAYVCRQFVCQAPVTDPISLERQIA